MSKEKVFKLCTVFPKSTTQKYVTFGKFPTLEEAERCKKYSEKYYNEKLGMNWIYEIQETMEESPVIYSKLTKEGKIKEF